MTVGNHMHEPTRRSNQGLPGLQTSRLGEELTVSIGDGLDISWPRHNSDLTEVGRGTLELEKEYLAPPVERTRRFDLLFRSVDRICTNYRESI